MEAESTGRGCQGGTGVFEAKDQQATRSLAALLCARPLRSNLLCAIKLTHFK